MKELTSYNRVAGYLNKIFDLLNAEFFEGALSRPTITIQSTPKAYGHFSLREVPRREPPMKSTLEPVLLPDPLKRFAPRCCMKWFIITISSTAFRIAAGAALTTTAASRFLPKNTAWSSDTTTGTAGQ